MMIERLEPHGQLFEFLAKSSRGRRYKFSTFEGQPCGVFREEAGGFWKQISPPPALKVAVHSHVAGGRQ